MEIGNIELLFLLTYIVEAIIQIKSLIKLKKERLKKYWSEFLGITIIAFITDALAYSIFASKAIGLSSAIMCIFVCGFILFCNVLLLIIGIVIKNIIKNKIEESDDVNKKGANKAAFIKSSTIVLVCNLIILLIIPIFVSKITVNNGEAYVIKYLEKRYGNGNYKIVNINKEYNNYGMWDKYLSGYYYEIKSDYMENTFIVNTDDKFLYVENDYFLPVYYSEKYNLYYELYYDELRTYVSYNFDELDKYIKNIIEEKYSIETEKFDTEDFYKNYVKAWSNIDGITYNPGYYIIPENYGKIPSINELTDLIFKYYNK